MVAALVPADLPSSSWEDGILRKELLRPMKVVLRLEDTADISWKPQDGWKGLSDRLAHLQRLGPNWNSYGAGPIDPAVIDFTKSLLAAFRPFSVLGVPAPSIIPTVHGGLQLEWHRGTRDLELEVVEPYLIQVLYADDATREEIEFGLTTDIQPVLEHLIKFASRGSGT